MSDPVVYPTSILAEGSSLEPLREAKFVASSLQIEVFHVLCFILILAAITGSTWYAIHKLAHKEKESEEAADKLLSHLH